MHKTGNKYITEDDLISLLSTFQLNKKDYCVLITLGCATEQDYRGFDGNRYSDPILVVDPYNLSNLEMELLTNGRNFKPYTGKVTL